MPFPSRRIFAGPVPARYRPIENAFDATAYATTRLGHPRPDRFQDAQHERQINGCDGQLAEHRIDVISQRAPPLLLASCRTPAGLMRLDVSLGAFLEAHSLGALAPRLSTCDASSFDRIDMIEPQFPAFLRLLAGFGERDRVERP